MAMAPEEKTGGEQGMGDISRASPSPSPSHSDIQEEGGMEEEWEEEDEEEEEEEEEKETTNRVLIWGGNSKEYPNIINDNIWISETNIDIFNEMWEFDLPERVQVKQIATNATTVCLLSRCGRIFSWGVHAGHIEDPKQPTPIPSLLPFQIIDIAAGESFFIALSDRGSVFTWGSGAQSLGHGDDISRVFCPRRVRLLKGEIVSLIAASSENAFAVREEKCFVWGKDACLLGTGATEGCYTPQCLYFPSKIRLIAAGLSHVGVVTDEGGYFWGSNNFRECIPNYNVHNIHQPQHLESNFFISSLALGDKYTLALSDDHVFGWGMNDFFQLGLENNREILDCTLVQSGIEKDAILVAGSNSSAILERKTYVWGKNNLRRDDITSSPSEINFKFLVGSKYVPGIFHISKYTTLSVLIANTVSSSWSLQDFGGQFLLNFEKYYNIEEWSDFVINVGGTPIYTSKYCLASQCSYFRSLFQANMVESRTGVMSIDDFHYDVVYEMLNFLHCGQCNVKVSNGNSSISQT